MRELPFDGDNRCKTALSLGNSGRVQLVAAPLSVLVLLLGSLASGVAAEQKSSVAPPPVDCRDGNGPLQLLNPSLQDDLLEQSAEQHYEHAQQLYSAGDTAAAENESRKAIEERPAHGPFVESLARLYIAQSRYDAAIAVIRGYTNLCGTTSLGYALEAELLFQQRRYDDALAATVASVKLFPARARMHQILGLILLLRYDKLDASVELQKAAELDPDDADIRYFFARSLYLNGRYPEARDQFLACLRLDPNYRKALENLGLSYQALSDHANAAKYYQAAIERERSEPKVKHGEPFGYYGSMLIEMGKPQEALRVLQEGAEASPRSLVVNFELGRAFRDLNQEDQAEHFLLIAAKVAPNYAQTHYLLERIYHREGRAKEADQEQRIFQSLNANPANLEFPITDR